MNSEIFQHKVIKMIKWFWLAGAETHSEKKIGLTLSSKMLLTYPLLVIIDEILKISSLQVKEIIIFKKTVTYWL